jgi:asparagine synthetase B (glutamine-hydrolysing)
MCGIVGYTGVQSAAPILLDGLKKLEYRGYDYKFVLGEGGHSIEHGGAILPETLEWLWRDHK